MRPFHGSYWQTRVYYLHFLGFLYFNAFLIAYFQNEALIGVDGLTPASLFFGRLQAHFPSQWEGFINHPTLFWYIALSNERLNQLALLGCLISLVPMLFGVANIPVLFSLWALYFSIVNVGQTWYSFGKYPKMTPTSWVTVWGNRWMLFRIMIGAGMIKIRGDECWRDLTCMNYHYQTQPNPNPLSTYFHHNPEWVHKMETMGNHVVELACPWLLLIPHSYVQRVAGSLQIFFQIVLILSGNLAFLNWLTILPAIMCFDDAMLCSPRKLQEINSIQEQYDAVSPPIFPFFSRFSKPTFTNDDNLKKDEYSNVTAASPSSPSRITLKPTTYSTLYIYLRRVLSLTYLVVVVWGSIPVVNNLLSPTQHMNISFGSFRLINSYGAFGSITKVRHEVVLEGTRDVVVTKQTQWKEFEFFCKPGDIDRTPCLISPYHLRIDWLMWFAAFQSYQHCPWLVNMAYKLLQGDVEMNGLLAGDRRHASSRDGNPFYNSSTIAKVVQTAFPHRTSPTYWQKMEQVLRGGTWQSRFGGVYLDKQEQQLVEGELRKKYAPRFVRASLYEYQYTPIYGTKEADAKGWQVGKQYKRRRVREYMPPITLDNPQIPQFLKHYGLASP
eukprot:gene28598-34523_t